MYSHLSIILKLNTKRCMETYQLTSMNFIVSYFAKICLLLKTSIRKRCSCHCKKYDKINHIHPLLKHVYQTSIQVIALTKLMQRNEEFEILIENYCIDNCRIWDILLTDWLSVYFKCIGSYPALVEKKGGVWNFAGV